MRTGGADGDFNGDDESTAGLARRQRDLSVKHGVTFAFHPLAEKRGADAFDDAPHGGEVDGNLVRKALVRHQLLWR
jgi:hypothetical protein